MVEKHCNQIEDIGNSMPGIYNAGPIRCKILSKRCVASTYSDPDPGSAMSMGFMAKYDDKTAREVCPVYNPDKGLIDEIKRSKKDNGGKTLDSLGD